MSELSLIDVLDFATKAHEGQQRKYTGEPYIFHPVEVSQIVAKVTPDTEVIAAAMLHDTVEDTDVTDADIRAAFGDRVADLVCQTTKATMGSKENRAARKEIDRKHYSNGSPEAQTIKLADIISNVADIHLKNPSFAKVYVAEQEALVNSLTKGDETLQSTARLLIKNIKKAMAV